MMNLTSLSTSDNCSNGSFYSNMTWTGKAQFCIRRTHLIPSGGAAVQFSHRYFFPFVFLFGVVGNGLNLAVLNSKGMVSKTHIFLSAMAISDLLMFLVLFPISLDQYDDIAKTMDYVKFYIHAHIPLIAFTNWFSTASIWLTVGVTVERTVAVKFPIHARIFWKKARVVGAIVGIYLISFCLNCFHFFRRSVDVAPICGECGSFTFYWKRVDPQQNPIAHSFSEVSIIVSAVLTIIIPLLLLIILNVILVHDLRKNSRFITHTSKDDRRSRNNSQRVKANERKVTSMVVVIIASFILLNIPSGVVYIWEIAGRLRRQPPIYYEVAEVANMCVLLGKALNFILYCLSSDNFRKHLRLLCKEGTCFYRAVKRSRFLADAWHRQSGMTTTISDLSETTNIVDLSNDSMNCGGGGSGSNFYKKSFARRHSSLETSGPMRCNKPTKSSFNLNISDAVRQRFRSFDFSFTLGPPATKPAVVHLMSPKKFHSLSDVSLAEAIRSDSSTMSLEQKANLLNVPVVRYQSQQLRNVEQHKRAPRASDEETFL